MIPQACIQAWREHAPWPNPAQVEQDPFRRGELRVVVLNDVSHQDVGIQRRHQRQGFISSMLTRLPLGALSMPAMSRMDWVLARTSVSSCT